MGCRWSRRWRSGFAPCWRQGDTPLPTFLGRSRSRAEWSPRRRPQSTPLWLDACQSIFPVVAAALEAICSPEFNLHAVTVSTMGAAALIVVNGPIAQEIGLNSGVSVFGPGNRANATIGRAVRLVIMNVTGARPGELDKATIGHPGKYTWCMAEAEDKSPWEPLHVERGFLQDSSAVSVFPGLSPIPVTSGDGDPEGDPFGV